MTWKQNASLAVVLLCGTGVAWYEHSRVATLQREMDAWHALELSAASRQKLAHERDQARTKLQGVAAESAKLQADSADLLRLRGEATVLKRELRGGDSQSATLGTGGKSDENAVASTTLTTLASNVASIKLSLQKNPAQQVPELCLLEEQDWIKAARNAKLDTEENTVRTLARARTLAKERLIPMMSKALHGFIDANDGQLPTALSQLGPYFEQDMGASIFDRYRLVRTGDSRVLGPGDTVVWEKDRLTPRDSVFRLGLTGWGSNSPDE